MHVLYVLPLCGWAAASCLLQKSEPLIGMTVKDLRNVYVTLPSAVCIHIQGSSFIHNVKRNVFMGCQ